MKAITIASSIAILILISIITSLLVMENTEQALYQKTIGQLLLETSLDSEKALLAQIPELKIVRQKMQRAERLAYRIQLKTRGPVPTKNEQERLDLQHDMKQLRQLRKEIRETLKQFLETRDFALLPNLSTHST